MALPGRDGAKAERLLRRAVKEGAAALGDIARPALKRLLKLGPQALHARELFTEEERRQLADALAATVATADLLGRSRIRQRQKRAEELRGAQPFADEPTDFSAFDETSGLKPLAPLKALEYFKGLVPSLSADPQRFGPAMARHAFTLAVNTDQVLLSRIQDLIRGRLETGEGVGTAPREIARLLDDAGVSPRSPDYAEMLFRTNMKDAYNAGADRERQAPDVAETFPVWRYVGIRDGRQGKDHETNFDKYYPNAVSFAQVRGSRVFNCRCDQIVVDKWEWRRLRQAGARVADGYPDVPA